MFDIIVSSVLTFMFHKVVQRLIYGVAKT